MKSYILTYLIDVDERTKGQFHEAFKHKSDYHIEEHHVRQLLIYLGSPISTLLDYPYTLNFLLISFNMISKIEVPIKPNKTIKRVPRFGTMF